MASLPAALRSEPSFFDRLSMPVFGRGREDPAQEYLRRVVHGALAALAFLHERGVIHRSLGPSSVCLSSVDPQATPRPGPCPARRVRRRRAGAGAGAGGRAGAGLSVSAARRSLGGK